MAYNFGLTPEPIEGNSLDKVSRGLTNSLAGAGGGSYNRGADVFEKGLSTMQPSVDYWTKLLTGDRGTAMNAISPAVHAVNSQADQQRRTLAEGPRGGGTASNLAQLPQQQTAIISNLLSGAQSGAAQPLAHAGTAQSSLGLNEQEIGLKAMMDSLQALLARRGQNVQETGQNKALASSLANTLTGGATSIYRTNAGG
jgi:hypothetical protein